MSIEEPVYVTALRERIRELEEERDTLYASNLTLHDELMGAREALERVKQELGVPDEGYPVPVINAWRTADAALSSEHTEPTYWQVTREPNGDMVCTHLDGTSHIVTTTTPRPDARTV